MSLPHTTPAGTSAITGVTVIPLVTHADDRGFFREVLRAGSVPGLEHILQVSHSRLQAGVIKAWHYHPRQVEGWYVATGTLRLVLHDLRADSSSHGRTEEWLLGGDGPAHLLIVPPGVAHGCKCIAGPCDLFYLESMTYLPEEDQRIPQDDPGIGYDWSL